MKNLYQFIFLFLVSSLSSFAQVQNLHNLYFEHPTLGFNGDYTQFYRADEASEYTYLRLQLGDEPTGKFEIGYSSYSNSLWYKQFSLDGWGNGYFGGVLGLGTDHPFAGTSNLGVHVNHGNHSSLLLGNPIESGYGGIVQTTDQKHRVFIGANLYDDVSHSWNAFQAGKGIAGISVLADKGDWGNAIDFYVSEEDAVPNLPQMSIMPKGVGIGTSTLGTHKLAVNGSIRAKEIKVESNWSDFVFEKDYKLKSLNEVEDFINQHGHLPDVPTAKEVAENGVNIGETQALLLQKIEELTLYVIELKKENEAIKKKSQEQEQKIETLMGK